MPPDVAPPDLEEVDPLQGAQAIIDAAMSAAATSLEAFVRFTWGIINPGRPLIWGWHMTALCDHLEAVTDGRIKKLVINVPPGHSKTSLVSICWPCWELLRNPTLRVISASYSDQLTKKSQNDRIRLLQSPLYKMLMAHVGAKWSIPKANTEELETNYGGFMLATSVGGQGTGRHGDRVLVDDALKAADIHTIRLRTHVTWFKETLLTRVTDAVSSAFVIVMQRLHASDLAGELIKDPEWVHLCLPAEYDPDNPCETCIGFKDPRTKKGELLFPARFPQDYIDKKKGPFGIGPMAFAAQDNQNPVAGDGNIFQRIWWRFWSDDPKDKSAEADTYLPGLDKFDELLGSWDMTFKDKDDSDFVVGQVWGRIGANFYLLEEERGRLSYTDTRRAVVALAKLWPEVTRWLVEDKANGPAILNDLRSIIPGLIPVTPKESKVARAQAVAPLIEAGNVFIPSLDLVEEGEVKARYGWVKNFVEECAAFPVAENDDRVDAMSQALHDLRLRALSEGAYLPAGTPDLKGNRTPESAAELLDRFRRGGAARPKSFRVPKNVPGGLESARKNPYKPKKE
ncbi:MAG: phage terminase large subunit [Actinomycetales bacterium]|nr:phage terminase large subunit [Actinomycetales bacterium]